MSKQPTPTRVTVKQLHEWLDGLIADGYADLLVAVDCDSFPAIKRTILPIAEFALTAGPCASNRDHDEHTRATLIGDLGMTSKVPCAKI
jgi:hypothetical protein